MMNKEKKEITPDTKVAELLKSFPELEEVLLQLSPAFAALRNPVLRNTVAKVTPLRQAAKVGNIDVIEMVNTLRKAVGMAELAELSENFCRDGEVSPNPTSTHVSKMPVTYTLDVRPIIEAGEHPKDLVLAKAEKLSPGECMELISPFPPVPLINLLENKGFKITMLEPEKGLVRTFVKR